MFPLPKDTNIEEYAVKARFPSLKDYHYDAENNFLWVDSVVGGTIPGNFMPAIEKGFRDRLERGVIAGYKVQNVCVEVHFGKHHPVDSSEQAFKTAASMAFRNVFQKAKPSLLEPIVKIEITVPSSKVGDITSDMSGRRGRVLRMDSAGGDLQTVVAEVPAGRSDHLRPQPCRASPAARAATRSSSATTTWCRATCSRRSSPRPSSRKRKKSKERRKGEGGRRRE